MRRFKVWQGVLSLCICLIVVACGGRSPEVSPDTNSPTAEECRILTHELGESEICGTPEKVAVLTAHSLDLLLSLGQQPAGVTSLAPATVPTLTNPEQVIPYLGQFITTEPVNLGGLANGPSLETMTQLQPDLIIGETGATEETYDLLSQLAPTIALVNRSDSGNWAKNLRTVAIALGDESLADQKLAEIDGAIAELKTKFEDLTTEHPKILVIAAQDLSQGFGIINSDSFVGDILTEVGFELIAPEGDGNSVAISLEALPDFDDADSILILGYDVDSIRNNAANTDSDDIVAEQSTGIRQEWADNPIAQSLTASQNDRVYFSTFLEWNVFNGPIGIDLVLQKMQQIFLEA